MTNARTERLSELPAREVFRRRLRETRRALDLTQVDLAARVTAQGGVMTQTTITRLERGSRAVTVDELFSLAAALDVSPLALLLPLDSDVSLRLDRHVVTPRQLVDWVVGREPLRGWGDDPESVYAYERLLPRVLRELRTAEMAVMARWQITRELQGEQLTPEARTALVGEQARIETLAEEALLDRRRRRSDEWLAGLTDAQRRQLAEELLREREGTA